MIMEVMQTVPLSSNTILATPQPGVQVTDLNTNAVELELSFSLLEVTLSRKAKSELLDLVYRHAKATGLSFAPPRKGQVLVGGRPSRVVMRWPPAPHSCGSSMRSPRFLR